MTLLEAINIVLRGVGEGQVQDVDSTHPSVESAKAIIKESQQTILATGLWFNTEKSITIPLDVNGVGSVPFNTISVTGKHPNTSLLVRGTTLYDPVNNTTDLSGRGDIVVDYIFEPDFDDIPVLAQQAIVYSAAAMFIADDDGDTNKFQRADARAYRANVTLATEDIKQKRLNALNAPATARVRIGMKGGRGVRSGDTIGGR